MALYESLGFLNHPFTKTNAAEEEYLEKYFVSPPYFDAIVGDSNSPSSGIVLAPRGAGKTAQRIMLEREAIELKFLAVTYDRFEFGNNQKVHDVTLQYHLKNIIIRILISFLSYVSEYPDLINNLSKTEKKQLAIFINTYLGELTGDSMQEMMKELKSLPEKFKDFWKENIGFMESVVNFLLKNYGLDEIDLPEVKQEEKKLNETYKYQLENLLTLVKKIGFKSIYVLIDRPDETEQTGNNPEKTYRLIQPMVRDLELLGLEGYGFKFFLWDQIEPFYRDDARPDRVPQYKLKWTRFGLKELLSKRLAAYSNNKITSFDSIVKDAEGIDDIICLMANGSPRNMIRLCEKIFAIQGNKDIRSEKIDYVTIDRATVEFSEQLVIENYGDTVLKEIQRIGRELFTTNYVSNDILKITTNGGRSKITGWIRLGLVVDVGTVSVTGAKKPIKFYCIVDPQAVRLIHRAVSLKKFLEDRWLPCEYCETDNLMNIELYPEDNEAICRQCGRPLL